MKIKSIPATNSDFKGVSNIYLYQNTKLALKTGKVSFTDERRKIPAMQSFNNKYYVTTSIDQKNNEQRAC